MAKVKKAAAAFAACLCIASSAAYLSVSAAAADDITYDSVVFGQTAAKSTIYKLKNSLYYSDRFMNIWNMDDIKIPVLKKNRVVKNCLEMSENDELIIPAGRTLTLHGGADIRGTIYIENGGKLLLDRYSVDLYGKIVCFGTIEVTGGTLCCSDDSLLYVAEGGEFIAVDRGVHEDGVFNSRITASEYSTVVCLGECNIPDPTFAGEPIAAVYYRMDSGGTYKKVSNATSELPDLLSVKFNTELLGDSDSDFCMDYADIYTIMFSGGNCVRFIANGSLKKGWRYIDGVDVQLMTSFLNDYHAAYPQ